MIRRWKVRLNYAENEYGHVVAVVVIVLFQVVLVVFASPWPSFSWPEHQAVGDVFLS